MLLIMNRRDFLYASAAFAHTAFAAPLPASPLRFAHRQANIVITPGQSVFEFATRIPGLMGIELQMYWQGQHLADTQVAAGYKREASRWSMAIPSVAGVWAPGETIYNSSAAEKAITNAIRIAEFLGARVILIALYKDNCPKMNDESSYAPVVSLLQKLAPAAAAANVTLGLETSLTAADDKKLVTLVDHAAVRTYADPTNTAYYNPGADIVAGIELLGSLIVQCHFKNGDQLLEAKDARVNWPIALKALTRIPYRGWYVFESNHSSPEQCIQSTTENIRFITREVLADRQTA